MNAAALRRLCRAALMAALLCVLSPLALPMGPVPLSLGLLGILLCASLLAPAAAWGAVALYLSVGALGLPVFAGAQGGVGVLLGPLGGYLWSFLLLVLPLSLASSAIRRARTHRAVLWLLLCFLLSTFVCYSVGNAQYSIVTGAPFFPSLLVSTVPFLLPDALKCLLASILVPRLWRTGLFQD